ncbi:hypothetical protein [Egicoccus sp. AB-alg2]|uniref:hypothetical protein n=1 Tax=Egicoccus sp. AB-alg2 TaxID=3242693 RepID=UPI00359D6ABE
MGGDEFTVTLAVEDRNEFVVADRVEVDACGHLDEIAHDDVDILYVYCQGGASARYLYAIEVDGLDLRVHGNDGERLGWLVQHWERDELPGQADRLHLHERICEPSCAEGSSVIYTLERPTGWSWNLTLCTYEDGTRRAAPTLNASFTTYLDVC